MLKDIKVAPSFSVDTLVRKTVGLSGSDLKETCRNAAMVRRSLFSTLSSLLNIRMSTGTGEGIYEIASS